MSFSAVLCKSTGQIYDNIPDISSVTNHKFVPMIDSNPKVIDDGNTDTSFKINNDEQETYTNDDEQETDINNDGDENNWW